MTRPLFLADPDALTDASPGSRVSFEGAEARHAAKTRRLRVGEHIDISDGRGCRVTGSTTEVSSDRVAVDVVEVVREPQPQPRIVVVQALAKGDRGERAVETMTEVGVDVIVPWAAQRCVTRWDHQREIKGRERWASTARESAKQSRRAWIPEVTGLADLDQVRSRVAAAGVALVLDTDGRPLPQIIAGQDHSAERGQQDWVVIVGPEGGFEAAERDALVSAGAQVAGLGPTVLRTSTAGTVAAAIIASWQRWPAMTQTDE